MADAQNDTNWQDLRKEIAALLMLVAIAVAIITSFIVFVGPRVAHFFSTFSTLDTGVIVALIAGAVSIITLVGGSVLNNRMKRREYLYQHRETPYMQLISMFYDFQKRARIGKEFTEEELLDIFTEFNKEITLWGSSKAIKIWGNWRVASAKERLNPKDVMFGMEDVMIQLRKDMGLKRGINRGDLLRLVVNDIDDYIKN